MTIFEANKEKFVIVRLVDWERLSRSSAITVGRKDICEMLGIAKSTLSESPWILPNNGIDAKGRRNYRWPFTVIIEWWKIPVEKRKEDYLAGNH